MRIVAGELRGRRLHGVGRSAARGTRPTTARAREGIFNWLGPRVAELRVLDLFAGTGSLGIEALSRGAREALFVEAERGAVELLRRNLSALGLRDRARVRRSDVRRVVPALKRERMRFDLILADPPYGQEPDWPRWLVCEAGLEGILEPHGVVLVERSRAATMAFVTRPLEHRGSRRSGGTAFDWYDFSERSVEKRGEPGA